MPTYLTLVNWTQQGIENVTNSPARLDDAKDVAADHGGEFVDFYMTFGDYDLVAVTEFPDDESYARFALTIGRGGNVSTETLKAFPEEEYRDLIAALSD